MYNVDTKISKRDLIIKILIGVLVVCIGLIIFFAFFYNKDTNEKPVEEDTPVEENNEEEEYVDLGYPTNSDIIFSILEDISQYGDNIYGGGGNIIGIDSFKSNRSNYITILLKNMTFDDLIKEDSEYYIEYTMDEILSELSLAASDTVSRDTRKIKITVYSGGKKQLLINSGTTSKKLLTSILNAIALSGDYIYDKVDTNGNPIKLGAKDFKNNISSYVKILDNRFGEINIYTLDDKVYCTYTITEILLLLELSITDISKVETGTQTITLN